MLLGAAPKVAKAPKAKGPKGGKGDGKKGKKGHKPPCIDFHRGRGCSKGDQCKFSHSEASAEELAAAEEKRDRSLERMGIKAEDKGECHSWLIRGQCMKMDKCPYTHDPNKRGIRAAASGAASAPAEPAAAQQ